MMKKPPELYVIQEPEKEPETPVKREVLHLSGIRSHQGPAEMRPVAPPWPRQVDWRAFLRAAKSQTPNPD